MMPGRDPVEIEDCEVIAHTDLALLIKCNGIIDKKTGLPLEKWIPRSVIHDDSEVYDEGAHSDGTLVLFSWFAIKEDLV